MTKGRPTIDGPHNRPSRIMPTLPEEWVAVEAAMDQALADFDSFGLREGAALAEDLAANIGAIQRGLEEVPAMEEERVAHSCRGRL